ncbi:unnamed protein product [Caenorhabditis auriculariae]|uniref:Uncharacterized protein n=1 Tax=Caenorhabditis auriculariae TaxID=2777116 RepID=A0A8S1HLG2_9PELO|nr:unnamed protein product [Caenorhabditis auriculariae]
MTFDAKDDDGCRSKMPPTIRHGEKDDARGHVGEVVTREARRRDRRQTRERDDDMAAQRTHNTRSLSPTATAAVEVVVAVMELGQGAFKTKKSALSLDLNDETGVSSLTVTPDQAFSDDAMNAQKQYAQGFLDALRVVQQSNKFEFTGLSPTALPMLRSTPAELMSPLLTPTNSRDMRAIMYGLLGTPGMTASQTKVMTSSNGVSPTSAPCGNGLGLDALSLPTTLALDNQSLLSLAAVALPGPPISTTTTTTSSLASSPTMPVSLANLSCLTNIATSSLPSTSRPDKFNLTPPQLRIDTVEDSDASESRSRSSSSAPSSNRREEATVATVGQAMTHPRNSPLRDVMSHPPPTQSLPNASPLAQLIYCLCKFFSVARRTFGLQTSASSAASELRTEMHHQWTYPHGQQHLIHQPSTHHGFATPSHADFSGYSSSDANQIAARTKGASICQRRQEVSRREEIQNSVPPTFQTKYCTGQHDAVTHWTTDAVAAAKTFLAHDFLATSPPVLTLSQRDATSSHRKLLPAAAVAVATLQRLRQSLPPVSVWSTSCLALSV